MSQLKIRTEYCIACWLVERSYGLTAFFRQARFKTMMRAHRLKLKLAV
ncbi:hypothetical protein PQU94_11670 [Asticcacaulis sp. DXS10W]|jgi:hypothetical protein|uniref:Uncharacterized protein n=1 Tax=Asticcacaulis currens TaxID=2984210 RepID=A0ABT5IFI3_9CAUL|nr:hypothetical protein [Asticcacaulis currens]MDC7694939.1 hypothetical protein [Asticcacaulis currens]